MATHTATPKTTSIVLPSGKRGINLRAAALATATDIGDLNVGQSAEGTLLGSDPTRLWMNIETIDGVPVTKPTYCAYWLCDGSEIVVTPPVPVEPNIEVKVTLFDDWTGEVATVVNSEVVNTWTGRLKPPFG